MQISYKTIEYRDKISDQYDKKIHELLAELPQYCSDYELYARKKNSIKTRMEYLTDISNFFRYLVSENPRIKAPQNITADILEKLNSSDWDKYLDWLSNYKFDKKDKSEKYKTNTNASKKRKMMAIRSLYHFLYVMDYIACNPTEKAVLPTVENKKSSDIAILEDKRRKLFLAEIDKKYVDAKEYLETTPKDTQTKKDKLRPYLALRDKAIVYLILGTGLRVSELCAINCSDISYQRRYINVFKKGSGNSREATDKVYLSDEVMGILLDYINIARDQIGANEENYDALFLSSLHRRMTPRAIELMVKEYADKALGTDNKVHPNALRATFETRCTITDES
ncbi:tyrosine-type recombinase/integrase [Butyrivibrio sp. VCB2006]|uniref:tyrosine-type recombinase/integrase n=1 Tax=Butyrivibrio sp. VCB2006 TaxID=1280679 RepID=UPI0003F682DF|nr:tyrosine-type recombinase/integrase [Butyrivibrio sp. VCB2006]